MHRRIGTGAIPRRVPPYLRDLGKDLGGERQVKLLEFFEWELLLNSGREDASCRRSSDHVEKLVHAPSRLALQLFEHFNGDKCTRATAVQRQDTNSAFGQTSTSIGHERRRRQTALDERERSGRRVTAAGRSYGDQLCLVGWRQAG